MIYAGNGSYSHYVDCDYMYIRILCATDNQTHKNKKAEDLSVMSWMLWTVSAFANLLYSLLLGRCELIIASISEFLLIVTTFFLTIHYKVIERKNDI